MFSHHVWSPITKPTESKYKIKQIKEKQIKLQIRVHYCTGSLERNAWMRLHKTGSCVQEGWRLPDWVLLPTGQKVFVFLPFINL